MSQAAATKLMSKLRYKISDRRKLRNPLGPKGRHDKIKKTLTALLKHERIELNYHRGDETRGYAERLISEAIRNGENHKETMEMASYWIIEPQIVHKLFKVLAPRYTDFDQSYTKMWKAPNVYPSFGFPKCVLELRNNIYPPLEPDKSYNKNLIHNVLLEEAKKVYRKRKADIAAMEQKLISESEASQSKTEEKTQNGPAVDVNVDSLEVKGAVEEGDVSSEENLKVENVNANENVKKEEEEQSLEADLSKTKISEETVGKDEKK